MSGNESGNESGNSSNNNSSSSSSSSAKPQLTTDQMLQIYNKYIPQIAATATSTAANTDTGLAKGTAGANQILTQSGLDQLNSTGAGYQKTGANLSNAQAQSTADLLNGSGGNAASAAESVARSNNPDYYKVQDAASNQATNLVNSYNLNGLSPGEQNAVERSTNQGNAATGNLGNTNALNTVANAMNFGNAYQTKQTNLGNAIGTANNTATSAQNQGFNPVTTALNSGSAAGNFGLGQFNSTQANGTTTAPLTLASGLGGNVASSADSTIAKSASSSFGSGSGSGQSAGLNCCFIFLEAQNGKMPWWVRMCRDEYYASEPKVATGYKRSAKILVPAMKYIPGVKWVVNHLMVIPLTQYGGWLKHVEGYESFEKNKSFKTFWFAVWKLIGGF